MSLVNTGQLCVPVSSLAQAVAAVAADECEGKLINLDTSNQPQSHLPLILLPKLGHTWDFTHLLSRSSTQTQEQAQTHEHMFISTPLLQPRLYLRLTECGNNPVSLPLGSFPWIFTWLALALSLNIVQHPTI